MNCGETDVLSQARVRNESRRYLLAEPALRHPQDVRRLDDCEYLWRGVHHSTRSVQAIPAAGVGQLRQHDVAASIACCVSAPRFAELGEGRRVLPTLRSPVTSVAECVRPGAESQAAILGHPAEPPALPDQMAQVTIDSQLVDLLEATDPSVEGTRRV